MTNDMTVGKPTKLILAFSIPMLVGNIFQQFYSMVDTIVVGRFIGVQALAAVGVTGAMVFLVLGFIQGLTNGFAVIIAQKFGANNEKGVKRAVAMSFYLSIASTIIITTISLIFAMPLLRIMKTPNDIINDSFNYIFIIYGGTVVVIFYNLFASILRALGDSKTPLNFLILSSIINVVLDILLVVYIPLGVKGTAIATIISQGISCFLCYFYMKKKFPILKLSKKDWILDIPLIRRLLNIGVPAAIQYSIIAIGVMILQVAINGLGSTVVASYTAASKVEQLVTQPATTFGTAMATYAAQNLGAKKIGRIKEGVRKCIIISTIINVSAGIILVLFGRNFTKLFVSADKVEVIEYAQQYLNTISVFLWILGLLFIYRNTIQGIGNASVPMMAGIAELVMRIIAAVGLSTLAGYIGICFASPIAWIGSTIILISSYYVIMKKFTKKHQNEVSTVEVY